MNWFKFATKSDHELHHQKLSTKTSLGEYWVISYYPNPFICLTNFVFNMMIFFIFQCFWQLVHATRQSPKLAKEWVTFDDLQENISDFRRFIRIKTHISLIGPFQNYIKISIPFFGTLINIVNNRKKWYVICKEL